MLYKLLKCQMLYKALNGHKVTKNTKMSNIYIKQKDVKCYINSKVSNVE